MRLIWSSTLLKRPDTINALFLHDEPRRLRVIIVIHGTCSGPLDWCTRLLDFVPWEEALRTRNNCHAHPSKAVAADMDVGDVKGLFVGAIPAFSNLFQGYGLAIYSQGGRDTTSVNVSTTPRIWNSSGQRPTQVVGMELGEYCLFFGAPRVPRNKGLFEQGFRG